MRPVGFLSHLIDMHMLRLHCEETSLKFMKLHSRFEKVLYYFVTFVLLIHILCGPSIWILADTLLDVDTSAIEIFILVVDLTIFKEFCGLLV